MDLNNFLRGILYVVLTVLLPIAVRYGIQWIKTFKANTDSKILNDCIDNAVNMISDIVLSVNQTYVDELKKNGKFTKEAQSNAFNTAKNMALKLISNETKSAVVTLYGDFEKFIETKIEAEVNNAKKSKEE